MCRPSQTSSAAYLVRNDDLSEVIRVMSHPLHFTFMTFDIMMQVHPTFLPVS